MERKLTAKNEKSMLSPFHGGTDSKFRYPRGRRQHKRILMAAASLFSRKGYPDTSIEDIAQRAGINRATIYYYFENKAQLLFEIISLRMKELNALTASIVNSPIPPEEKLKSLITNHIRSRTSSKPNIVRVGLVRAARNNLPPKLLKAYIDMRDEYEGVIGSLIGEIMVKSNSQFGDAGLATKLILGMLNWVNEWYSPKGKLSAEEIAAKAYELVAGALGLAKIEASPEDRNR